MTLTATIPISFKKTYTPGRVPTASDIGEGQLFINMADQKAFTIDKNGVVFSLAISPTNLATVATSGSYNDLINKLTTSTGLAISGSNVLSLSILDTNNVILTQYLPSAITGSINYKGTYDASTNTPAIPAAATGNNAWLYVVSKAGTFTDPSTGGASTAVNPGDQLISNGTIWQVIPQINSGVLTVNGQTGNITLTAATLGISAVGLSGHYSDLIGAPPSLSNISLAMSQSGSPIIQPANYIFTQAITFPTNFTGSKAFATLNSGTSATIQIQKCVAGQSTFTQVGSISYSTSTNSGTFTTSGGTSVSFAVGDILQYSWSTSNITNIAITLAGTV